MAQDFARRGAFISYARHDGEKAAREIHARLSATAPDVPAWMDRLELEGGVGWWHQIEEQLERAEFLILVVTPAALRSENTRREWRSARQRGVCVYPVLGMPATAVDFARLPSWMARAHFYDPTAEWPTLVAHLRRGCQATRVPFMAPPLPSAFVPRPRETEALISLLRAASRDRSIAITTALRGAGGFGKTTLAAAICHDDRVLEQFDDGILWVTLGQTPNLLNELTKLHAALTGQRPGFVDVEDAARELAVRLQDKHCLVVIDDAWSTGHVTPILRASSGCARLITTRVLEVAAEASRVDVDQMDPAEALQLLLARAGVDPADPAPFRELASRLGGWPLPIKLLGSAIRQRLALGDSLPRALDYASRALTKRGVTAFDKANTSERHDAVSRTVGASLDLLSPDEQRRFTMLSIFPEDTAIPLATAALLWRTDDIDSEDLARKLDDLGLLEFDLRWGTLRLHDVLRAFLAERTVDAPAWHAELIEAWGDAHALPSVYAWRRYTYHLQGAGRGPQCHQLLLDPRWLSAKLQATDIHSLVADYEPFAADPVLRLVRDALRLAAPTLALDPLQLPAQLAGRLLGRDERDIVALQERIARATPRPWLRPMLPALDPPGGMLVMTLVGHEGEITSLAADASGTRLLSASEDGTIRVWDREHGQVLRTLHHRHLGARSVASDRDGTWAVSGGADGILYLWDLSQGERIPAFRGERGPALTAVALSEDARLAISGSRENVVRLWDVSERTARGVLKGHNERVTSVALAADGRRALSGSEDGTIRVWNLESDTLERTLDAGQVNAVAISPDGRWGLSGSSDRLVRFWDLDAGVCVRELRGHASSVTAVALAATAKRALSGSSDQTARLWDLHTGETLATLGGHSDTVTTVSIDRAGVMAATGSSDRTIKLWRLVELTQPSSVTAHSGSVTALVFSSDGRLVASGGTDGRMIVRDVASGRPLRIVEAHSAPVRSVAFTEDNECVLSSGMDHKYSLWTVEEGGDVWLPIRHTAPVDYCALTPRARYLLTACGDRFVYLWDVPSGALVERYGTRRLFDHLIAAAPKRRTSTDLAALDYYLPGESVFVVHVVRLSADGQLAVLSAMPRHSSSVRTAKAPGQARSQLETSIGACLLVLNIHSGEVRSLTTSQTEPISAFAVGANATRLLWAKADHTVEWWDLREAKHLTTLRGHTGKVNAVGLSDDGRHALTCSRDRTLRVWDLADGRQLASYTADAALRALAPSPSEPLVAVGDVAGRVHILRFEDITPQGAAR